MGLVSRVVENLCSFPVGGDQRDRHGIVINFPRYRLRKFLVNHDDKIKVVIDKNILYTYIHIIKVKWPLAALENFRVVHDIPKDERPKSSKRATPRVGTLPSEYMGDKTFRHGNKVVLSGIKWAGSWKAVNRRCSDCANYRTSIYRKLRD